MKNRVSLVFLLTGIISLMNVVIAQDPIDLGCPNPTGSERAYRYVKWFLTFPDTEDERIKTAATNESVNQITPVDTNLVCSELNTIVQGNELYREIDESTSEMETKYFYQTNNLYYIFWALKPQYDDYLILGPCEIWLVVSKDYKTIWEFNL